MGFFGRPADFAELRFSIDEALSVIRVPQSEEVTFCPVEP